MSFTASPVADLGVDTPLSLSAFSYLALTLVYGSILAFRRQKLRFGDAILSGTFCRSLGIIIYFSDLLMSEAIVSLLGAAVCVLGLGLVLLSDSGISGGGGSKPLLGDALIIAATVFFAMSNVGEEFCVKKKDRVEGASMLGVFGTLVTVREIAIFERKSLESVKWSTEIILAFAGYALASFMFDTLVPCVLKMSGATMLNLSILTSDMWAVIIRIFLYHQQVDWLYYLSFAIVLAGLVIYSRT